MSAAPLLGALAVVSSIPVLWWAFSDRQSATATAGRNLRASLGRPDYRQIALGRPAGERAVRPGTSCLLRLARRLTPANRVHRLEQRLLVAGGSGSWPVERVLAVKVGGAAVVALLVLLWFSSGPGIARLVVGLAAIAFVYVVPDILVYNTTTKRKLTIQRELSDTLDQLTVCVEAGLSLEAAMLRVATTGDGPLHEELSRAMQDIRAGRSRSDALKALMERTKVDDLDHFVSAVIQADNYGLPVSRVLRIQASEARVKRRQRAEEAATKLPVKILFPVVLFIFPTLFIVLLGPAAIRIMETIG